MTRPNASWYFPKIFVKDANVFLSPLFWHIVFVVDVVVAVAVAIVVILGFFACLFLSPPPSFGCLLNWKTTGCFFPKTEHHLFHIPRINILCSKKLFQSC